MSLASERRRRQLICRCPTPTAQTVILFGFLELTDVFECGLCGRPCCHPLPAGALANYLRGDSDHAH